MVRETIETIHLQSTSEPPEFLAHQQVEPGAFGSFPRNTQDLSHESGEFLKSRLF